MQDLIHYVSGALGCRAFGITVLGVLGSAYLVMPFGFGYVIQEDDAQLQLAGQLLKFTFPYLALISYCLCWFDSQCLWQVRSAGLHARDS